MRKRKAARPVLEAMEDRMVLSGVSAFDPTAEVRSALTALFTAHHAKTATAHHAHPAAAHHTKAEATATHHHATKAAHPAQHHPAKSSNSGSTISNFFKSVFPGL